METTHKIAGWKKKTLVDELLHFQEVASLILPRRHCFPRLPSIDYFATITPHKGCVGGDHMIILNFDEYHIKERALAAQEAGNMTLAAALAKNFDRFGILIADAAGHRVTDNVTVNYLHAAFKVGVAYELKQHGEVTAGLFELLNMNFYNRMTPEYMHSKPFVTLIYGEVLDNGAFRYLSAGHPAPIVFSVEHDMIERLGRECTRNTTPLGVLPSEYNIDTESFEPSTAIKAKYPVNEITLLGKGDVLLLYTDGLMEVDCPDGSGQDFCDTRLEQVLRKKKTGTAKDIHNAIMEERAAFPIEDDITLAVIKKR